SKVVERPRVLYNDMTKRYVMWMHVDEADYELARCGVATSTRAGGPFTYRGSFRPHGHMCRDFTDDDGSAYIAYSSEDNKVMHIAQLTKDYISVGKDFVRTMVGMSREAPAMFKYKGLYLMLTSGCTGWDPNRAEIFFARSPLGQWESLGNPCIGGTIMARQRTFYAQATHVLPMPGRPGEFLFLADRWVPSNLGSSKYIWLPMWVREVPGGADIALTQQRIRRRQRFRSMRPGAAAANHSIPSIDVVVR
ncbi:Arabinanase/levansucrase/invertase, partial [Coccomyxa subellipsoidea C-169]